MTKMHCLLDDASDLPELDDSVVWFAYAYTAEPYEGYGEAVWLTKDGNLHFRNLGHCSCYGPFDGFAFDEDPVSVDQFLANLDQINSYIENQELEEKVRELLSKPSISVATRTTKQFTAQLDAKFVRQALGFSEDKEIPDNAEVFVRVPGGGDWSNTDLNLDDTRLVVRWTEYE